MKKKPFQVRGSIHPLRLSSLKNRCFKMYLLFFKISNSRFTGFTHRDIQTHTHDLPLPEHTHKCYHERIQNHKALKPTLIFPTQNIISACLQSQHKKNMKRCGVFLVRRRNSADFRLQWPKQTISFHLAISQISRVVSEVSPTDSDKFAK